jgi:hypothetical protein
MASTEARVSVPRALPYPAVPTEPGAPLTGVRWASR